MAEMQSPSSDPAAQADGELGGPHARWVSMMMKLKAPLFTSFSSTNKRCASLSDVLPPRPQCLQFKLAKEGVLKGDRDMIQQIIDMHVSLCETICARNKELLTKERLKCEEQAQMHHNGLVWFGLVW